MRVLHVLDHSTPLQSGYVSRTLGILRAQRALGLDPVCLTSPRHGASAGAPGQDVEELAGFRFHRTPAPRRALPGVGPFQEMRETARRLGRVIAQERPALIHAHSPSLNALPAIKAARRAGLPTVYEIRAFWEDAAVDLGNTTEGSPRYRLTRAMETLACRRAGAVFTICEGLRRDLLARGLPEGKIALAPNAVEPERLTPISERDSALAAQLALGEGPVLGFIGSFYHYEGLALLLEALPQIRESLPGARLLLVGGGPEEGRLRAQAERVGEDVIFTGRVPPEAVSAYYSLIDLLIYPRLSIRLTELVTPLKPLEAMAMTRRFIASDIGGHRELIRNGDTGRLFTPGDADALARAAMEAVNAPMAEDAAMRARALGFIREERSWRAVAARYLPVYERLTALTAYCQ